MCALWSVAPDEGASGVAERVPGPRLLMLARSRTRALKGSIAFLPTTTWQGTPPGGHLAHDLPLEGLVVDLALTGHDEGGLAHPLVEAHGVEHVGAPGKSFAPR